MLRIPSRSVFMAVLLCAATVSGCSSNIFEREYESEKAAVKLVRDTEAGGYGIVSTDEFKAMMADQTPEQGKAILVIDTMPFEESYKKSHVPGAESFEFPIPEMKEWESVKTGGKSRSDFEALLGPDKNKTIVFYCGFVKCTRSHNAAVWAQKLGYSNVFRYPGGIFAWKGAGLPVEKVD